MGTSCQTAGCKSDTPPALAEQRLCVLHFTLSLEANCSGMRRETALGNAPQERQREIMKFITENGECLARVATSGLAPDGRPEGANPEHIPYANESAGKPRPFEHAEFVRAFGAPASLNHNLRSGREGRDQAPM